MQPTAVLFAILFFFDFQHHPGAAISDPAKVYRVGKLERPMKIDGKWNKPQWKSVKAITVDHFIRKIPDFHPVTKVKMMYDDSNLFVIFQVKDRFVRSITKEVNGQVWKDAAVEFFFSPDTSLRGNYFNLEMNCGGTALLGYHSATGKKPAAEDTRSIEIAHSLPQVVDPEITGPVTWTLECRIPFEMIKKFSKITLPEKGVEWRANFYKIAENNSNPHHITWSVVGGEKPTFHMPEYFGRLQFQ